MNSNNSQDQFQQSNSGKFSNQSSSQPQNNGQNHNQNTPQQHGQNAQQTNWNNLYPNQSENAATGQVDTPNAQQYSGQSGLQDLYKTNDAVNNNAYAQQSLHGQEQAFRQTNTTHQINQSIPNQQFQQNGNQQFQQNVNQQFQQNRNQQYQQNGNQQFQQNDNQQFQQNENQQFQQNENQQFQQNGNQLFQQGENQQFQKSANQQFQQNGNQQFQKSANQQFQQNGNQQFQQNHNGHGLNTPSSAKKRSQKYIGLFLPTVVLAAVAALYNLSLNDGIDDYWWLFDSALLSNAAGEVTRNAAIAMITVGSLTLVGWLKENKWFILGAILASVVGMYFYSYVAIATLVLLIIGFVMMIKDSKKQKGYY